MTDDEEDRRQEAINRNEAARQAASTVRLVTWAVGAAAVFCFVVVGFWLLVRN